MASTSRPEPVRPGMLSIAIVSDVWCSAELSEGLLSVSTQSVTCP